MKVFCRLLMLFALVFANIIDASARNAPAKPKVILNADLDSDMDHMGALAMLLNLHKAGTIDG